MFCKKCGTKAVDGAVFCQNCGAMLIQGGAEAQVSDGESIQDAGEMSISPTGAISEVNQKSVRTSPAAMEMGQEIDICVLLKENAKLCPAIKSVKQIKGGVCLHGKIFSHFVRTDVAHAGQVRMKVKWGLPFSLLYGLPTGLFCILAWMILAEFIKYGSVCIEYYYGMIFAFCCLATGAVLLIRSLMGSKEKETVAAYVRGIAEPRHIFLSAGKGAVMSKIRIAAAVVLVLAGIIILPFNLPDLVEYPDELLAGGFPITRFLDMTQEDVELEFGEPDVIQNRITGDDYYNYYNDEFGGIDHVTYSKETGKVIYIQFYASECTYNQKKLDKSLERVVDILYERYPGNGYSFGVYGSKHSGFYYDDVYFGEIPTGEDYMVQEEFEDGEDVNFRFLELTAFGEKHDDAEWSSNVREKEDYRIDLITVDFENNDKLDGVYGVCLYTDEWVETLAADTAREEIVTYQPAEHEADMEDEDEGISLDQLYMDEDEYYTDYMYWGGLYDGGWMDTELWFGLYSDGSQEPECGYITTTFRGMEDTGKLYYMGANEFRWESEGYDSASPETYYICAVYDGSSYQLMLYNSDGEYEVTFTLSEQYIP